ncbi:LysM peptidoglycan-binding domain-containing protein [Solibacillus sp. MA9]|uniref:LysM peptidoglycan-binding domain-containing protein n=1 Tax=Solibacillus palustris TaxID=2908203 RepID=A0ABS9UA52_9BACL|nr:LysM peptidoglycan-binding domain-containing protein [Solibacillus sp. MA9]MCH7321211.1 LysM peptidoglycan-binding domain-containing protein [Solibacillus sp. MA9]
MTKEDYREKVEEHRQEIDLHNESGAKLSRTSRHQKKDKKKQSNPIMTLLVVVLIFIPLSILGYVWLFYEPSASEAETVEENKDNVVLEIVKQNEDSTKDTADDKGDEEKADDNKDKSTDTDKKAEQEKERLAAEEAKKAEEAQKIAAQKAKALEVKKKAEDAAKVQQKTHTVQSTDNLYRIAIKYYGDGSPANIEKIKSANNLTTDSISTGQVLVIIP